MRRVAKLFLASAAALAAASAQAAPIVWTLQDVAFADGGTAVGSFTFDTDTSSVSTFSISVSGGNTGVFPTFTYDNSTASVFRYIGSRGDAVFNFRQNGTVRQLRIVPNLALSDRGGLVPLSLTDPAAAECYNCGPFRLFTSGSLVAGVVPEPSSWAMLILGFASVGTAIRARPRLARAAT